MTRLLDPGVRSLANYFATVALLCSVGAGCQAGETKPGTDVLISQDGEKLIGELKSATGTKVIFKSDLGFEVTIEWSKIKELHSDKKFAAVPKGVVLKSRADAAKIPQGTLDMTDQKIAITPAPAAPAQTVAVADLSNVVEEPSFEHALQRQGFFEGWKGLATLGLGFTESTQSVRSFATSVGVERLDPAENWLALRNKTTVLFNTVYGNVSQSGLPTIKTEVVRAALERDIYFKPRVFFLVGAAFEHNYSQGLDLMQSYDAGIGYSFLKGERRQLDVRAGLDFVDQEFSTRGLNHKLIGSRFGETYTATFARGITFTEDASVRPAWNHPDSLFAGGTASLSVPVYKRLGINASSFESFIYNPPPGFKKSTYQLTIGASYTIK